MKVAEIVSNHDMVDGIESRFASIKKGLKTAEVRLVAGQRVLRHRSIAERFEECLGLPFQ